MGVSRLWTFVTENKSTFFRRADLVGIASSRPNGIHIIVDFYSWQFFIMSRFSRSVKLQVVHPYLSFHGGEYKLINIFITNFITALRNVHIELIFYLDAARGSSLFTTKQKWTTWKKRHFAEHDSFLKVLDFLHGRVAIESLDSVSAPCLQEIQTILTLQSLGCTVKQGVAGEADSFIAQHMYQDKDAFCIFSNDTDFCIFPGGVLLNDEMFDRGNDLCLGSPSLAVKTPERLICDIICSDHLWRHLKLPGVESLTEMAIIRGNDFTYPLVNEHRYRNLGMSRKETETIPYLIKMIRKYKTAENCPFYGKFISENPAMKEAVNHSRKFYSMQLGEEISDEDDKTDVTFQIILGKVRQCIYPTSIIAMRRGFYWHRHVVEEPSPAFMPVEVALAPLRAYIYGILLPDNINSAMEYGRMQSQAFGELSVDKVIDENIPTLQTIWENSFDANLKIFEYILSHQEKYTDKLARSFFKRYGIRKGFLFCLLRYFLLLNWDKNMCIRPREFLTFCAWILGSHNTEHYQMMKIIPSPRCFMLEEWFLLLYRLSYSFLGSLLEISHAFPTPAEIFSGATWVALYTSVAVTDPNRETAEHHPLSVPRDSLLKTSSHVFDIVNEHQQIISYIVDDVFKLCI